MKTINFGIVGFGRLGKRHAENIASRVSNAQLKAVCSIVDSELEEAKEKFPGVKTYKEYSEFLQNEELDAIFIASSSTEHCSQIEEALRKGFHVFSEKPLGVTLEEVKKVEKIVNSYKDQVFMLGFMRRYDKSYADAKRKIDEGLIGKPFLVRCYGLDPVKAVQGAIAFSKNSGGLFLDMAIHDLDLARWFLGSEPKSVYAIGGCFAYEEFKKYNDSDNGTALMQFENDTMGIFYAGRTCTHGYHIETEIIGTKGALRIGTVPEKNLVTIFNDSGVLQECVGGFLERFEEAYVAEVQEFVNCILEGRAPAVGVEDGVKSTEMAYGCKESFENKNLVWF